MGRLNTWEADFLPVLIRELFERDLQFLWGAVSVYGHDGIDGSGESHCRQSSQDSPLHWDNRRCISTPNLETGRCTGLRFHLNELSDRGQ